MAGWVQNASPAVNAASTYPTIISVCVSITTFMVVIVGLRVYVRAVMLKYMGADDWTIVFSAICSVVYNGLCIGQSRWGLGLPIALRPPQNLNQYSVINFAGRPFYMAGILGFKVALCLAYLRILSHGQRAYRIVVWSVLLSCTAGHIAGTLVLLFQCNPMQRSWIPSTPGYCLANVPTFTGLALVTIVFDVIIFLLPIPVLWNLHIDHRRRIALIVVFMLGLFTTVCSVLRLTRIAPLAIDGDSTYLVLWGTIEMNVGIALTCLPALTPLFTYFRQKTTMHSRGRNYPNSHELQSTGNSSAKSKVATHITSLSQDKIKPGSDDNDSQRGILVFDTSLDGYQVYRTEIKKTVEVDVQYEQGSPRTGNRNITSQW